MERYAGFWLRFIAYVIDSVIVNVAAFAIGLAVGSLQGGDAGLSATILSSGLGVLLVLLYWSVAESSAWQATPGKLAVGVCVTDLEGRRVGFGRALGRTLGKLLSVLFFGLGFLMAGWTARKQALHDLLAGTLVVQRARVASEQPAADPAAAGAAARMSGRAPHKATPREPEG